MGEQPRIPAAPPDRRATIVTGAGSNWLAHLQLSGLFREYQQAFEATTGLPLVLREAGSFRTPLQGSKRVNPFCSLMTQTNKTCAACLQLQQRLEEEARLEPKTLQCYAGLSETLVPVRLGHRVLGYLQTGQVFLRAPSRKNFAATLRAIQGPEAGAGRPALEAAYFQTRIVTKKQYESIVRLLAIFAEHFATVSNQVLLRVTAVESPVTTRMRAFVAAHQNEALSLRAVARAVNMSVCHFCKAFKKGTGLNFTEYVARARIESVKQMLLNAHTLVSEAAYAAGFQSLSQFNRVFLRITGETPGAYRGRIHGLVRPATRHATLVSAA